MLPSTVPRRPVILLVDDDADTLEMYQVGLAVAGFTTLGARDGASVARQLDAARPDAIVTDLQLHGVNGWEVMQALKRQGWGPAIPVILLTGYSSPDVDRQAREFGCAAVLTKPCIPDDLATVLWRVLSVT